MLTCIYMTKERTEGLNGLEFFFVKSVFFCLYVSFRDVRHPGRRWRTSLPDTEPIIADDRADLFRVMA